MKKLVFMFVAVAAISFASCVGQKAEAPVVEEDTTAVVEDTLSQDTLVQDSTVEEAPAVAE